jgi:hypothetical protein
VCVGDGKLLLSLWLALDASANRGPGKGMGRRGQLFHSACNFTTYRELPTDTATA